MSTRAQILRFDLWFGPGFDFRGFGKTELSWRAEDGRQEDSGVGAALMAGRNMPPKLHGLARKWRSLVGDRQLDRIRAIERRLIAIDHDLRSTMGYSHTTPISEALRIVSSAVAALGTEEEQHGRTTRSEVGNALIVSAT